MTDALSISRDVIETIARERPWEARDRDVEIEEQMKHAVASGDFDLLYKLRAMRRPLHVATMEARLAHGAGMDIDDVVIAAIRAAEAHANEYWNGVWC